MRTVQETISELEDAIRSATLLRTESVVIPKELAELVVGTLRYIDLEAERVN